MTKPMTFARACTISLEELGKMKARVDFYGGAHSSVFDFMRALRVVLDVDADDEERIERSRIAELARLARVEAERKAQEEKTAQATAPKKPAPMPLPERYRLLVGAVRDVVAASARLAAVFARVDQGDS